MGALFTADIKDVVTLIGESTEHLEDQCGFADSRVTGKQNQRSWNAAATEHAVTLRQTTKHPGHFGVFDGGQRLGVEGLAQRHYAGLGALGSQAVGAAVVLAWSWGLSECVPLAAGVASATPLGGLNSTVGAKKHGAGVARIFGHFLPPRWATGERLYGF
jgi:hypothetical protein